MALLKAIETRGTTANYWKIGIMHTDFTRGRSFVMVHGYTSQEYREDKPGDNVDERNFTLEAVTREEAYALLKQDPFFDNSVDVL